MVTGACNLAIHMSDVWLFSLPLPSWIHRNPLTYHLLAAWSRALSEDVLRRLLEY